MKRGQLSVGDLVTFAPYIEMEQRFEALNRDERSRSFFLTSDKRELCGKIFEVVGVHDGFGDDIQLLGENKDIEYISSYMLNLVGKGDINAPDISYSDLEISFNKLYGGVV